MAANTLLINGVDVRAQAGISVLGDMSTILYSPGTLRGQNVTIPGRRGQIGADLPVDAYTGDIQLQVKGADRHAMTSTLAAFLSAIRGGTLSSLCTLERRLDDGSGGYVSTTAAGQIVSNSFALLNSQTGRTMLTVANLDGAWTTDGGTTWVLA